MKKRQSSAYTRATLEEIKATAKKYHDAKEVRHIKPRAYCIAKPAPWCAVFVTPPCDAEPHVTYSESTLIHDKSVESVCVGDWCSLAYVQSESNGETRVIFNLSEKRK